MMDDITNLVRREIQRALVGLFPTVGLVSSYDPQTHAAKVTHQPDGSVSGLAPHVRPAAGGTNFCSGPGNNDQAVVMYLNGDRESPVILGYLHSDVDQPPNTPAGASNWTFKNGSIGHDANGNVAITSTGNFTVTIGGVTFAVSSSGIAVTGGTLTHNGKNIGSTHEHSGVTTGASNTGVPV